MSTIKWATPEAIQSYLTTELNTLANGSSVLGGGIDNLTDLYQFMEVEVSLASVDLSTYLNPGIKISLVPEIDGTNYADVVDSVAVAFAEVPATSAAHRQIVQFPIPPFSFKLSIKNNTGAALAGTGNTVKYRRFNQQVV